MSEQNSDRTKALQAALAQIEKQFGKGTIMRLGEGEVIEDIKWYLPALWVLTSPWALAVCLAAASLKYTAQSRLAKPHSPCK